MVRRTMATVDQAASNKMAKYTELAKTHHFTLVAIEIGGSLNNLIIDFVTELGTMITAMTHEPRETQYLFQRMSVLCREEMC